MTNERDFGAQAVIEEAIKTESRRITTALRKGNRDTEMADTVIAEIPTQCNRPEEITAVFVQWTTSGGEQEEQVPFKVEESPITTQQATRLLEAAETVTWENEYEWHNSGGRCPSCYGRNKHRKACAIGALEAAIEEIKLAQ